MKPAYSEQVYIITEEEFKKQLNLPLDESVYQLVVHDNPDMIKIEVKTKKGSNAVSPKQGKTGGY